MKTLTIASTVLALASTATAQWVDVSPASSPSGRGAPGMSFDSFTGNTVLFGGDTLGFPAGTVNETWTYNGSAWTLQTPTTSPGATAGIDMVYDVIRGVHVMYGGTPPGFFGGPCLDQTWEFDGANWTQVFPINTPGGLAHYGMVYDVARGVTVLYGGMFSTQLIGDSDQTWEYNGTDWTQVAGATQPGPMERPGMCYHEGLGKTVMFGGISVWTGGVDTTWVYDGTAWAPAGVTGVRPGPRTGCALSYDSTRQICVMTGGQDATNGTPFDDTWEFDLATATWTQIPNTFTFANARLDHGQVYDTARKMTVMFGGLDFQTFSAYGDTQEYGARSFTFGSGCAGSNGTPALDSNDAPRFGSNFDLTVNNVELTASLTIFAQSVSAITPVSLDPIGMTGCTGYVQPDVALTVTGSGGSATLSIAIPTSTTLMGTSIHTQALSFDPGINALWLTASNGHTGTIGN